MKELVRLIFGDEAAEDKDIVAFYTDINKDVIEQTCMAAFLHKDISEGLPFDYTDDSFEEWKKKNLK